MGTTVEAGKARADAAALGEICRRYLVAELSLFGSAARGEEREDSDLDILVEFLPESQIDLLEYSALMQELSQLFATKVDLVSKRGLKPRIRSAVLAEARLLYAA